MSHSTHVGFNGPGVISLREKPPCLEGGFEYAGPPVALLAVGVGKYSWSVTAIGREGFPLANVLGALLPSVAFGVGQRLTAPVSVSVLLPSL